jgi:hypothetical protein
VLVLLEPSPLGAPCHVWQGCVNSKGYPVRTVHGKRVLAHRYAVIIAGREIPDGHEIHHRCERRRCINEQHLEVTSPLDHNREHTTDPIPLRILARLSDCQPRRYRDLQTVAPTTNIGTILARMVKRGEITRIGRGTYTLGHDRRLA